MRVPEDKKRNWLINQIVSISKLLKEGRYDEIDLSLIEKEASELATNFNEIISSIEDVGYKLGKDSGDVQMISKHLKHITKTTEEGVMKIIDHSEAIVSEATLVYSNIETLKEKVKGMTDLKDEFESIDNNLENLKNHAFKIISSLEFEDINRQKLEKIFKRLNTVYDNLIKVLIMLKVKEKIEKKDSSFIKEIQRISGVEDNTAKNQDMIDELMREFGL